ncbi:MAG: hypothetical protein G01um10148_105 [Parcubacteria group bacterium Gr01-1014_8]|nr:MAG: hypothetical protein G01um10148_105 [Parcubacteria group bacterium Gr01-1014_8]
MIHTDISRIFKYASIGLIFVLIIGLGGWYIYLRTQTSSIDAASSGRGFRASIPTSSSLGSTFTNIISGFRRTPSEASENPPGISPQSFSSGISNFSEGVKTAFGNLISGLGSLVPGSASSTPIKQTPRLWQVQKSPVAGFRFIAATTTTLRFMERSSGYIFDVNPATGKTTRVTNTLIPKVYDARFARDGSPVIKTLENDVRTTYSATLASSSNETLATLVLTPLGNNVADAVPNATSRELLSLIESENGSSIVRSGWNGSKPTTLFSSSLSGWRMYWTYDNKVYIAQKAATGVPGNAYELLGNGELVPLARSVSGLTIVPKATSTALLIASDAGVVSTLVRPNADTAFIILPVKTIVDKCLWAPGNNLIAYCAVPSSIPSKQFLDEWYRGEIHTADSWWRVDASAGSAQLLFSPARESGSSLDAETPRIDNSGTYIAFLDSHDKSLWILRINE